jgi:hypothetical protein
VPTIMVDPEDRGVIAGTPIPGWKSKEVLSHLAEPIPEESEPCVPDGRPCILYANWDYAEDWSGETVRELHPFTLIGAPKLTVDEFWALVRRGRGVEKKLSV